MVGGDEDDNSSVGAYSWLTNLVQACLRVQLTASHSPFLQRANININNVAAQLLPIDLRNPPAANEVREWAYSLDT